MFWPGHLHCLQESIQTSVKYFTNVCRTIESGGIFSLMHFANLGYRSIESLVIGKKVKGINTVCAKYERSRPILRLKCSNEIFSAVFVSNNVL